MREYGDLEALRRIPGLLAGLVCLVMWACPAGAGIYTLTDGNSSAVIDSGADGMTDWTIDGVDHLSRQWFWFRVGASGGETNLGSLSQNLASHASPEYLRLVYQGSGFTVETRYNLTGGTPGSGTSDIAEVIRIINTGNLPLDFHFFQYCNLHLNDSTVNDSVEIRGGNTAIQRNGSAEVSETVLTPLPSHYEVGLFPSTVNSFGDGLPTTLSDQGGPIGPGDLTWAFEWDTTIAPGGTFLISKDKQIVPEPATLCLLALGGATMIRRRR